MKRNVRLPTKRVSIIDALFLCLFFVGFVGAVQARECGFSGQGERVQVESVIDGDTVWLKDGRKVRLIGINTPEIGRKGAPSEPLADKSRKHLTHLLADSSFVYLVVGVEPYDRYRRTLAHVFTNTGESIEEMLIREGLGFVVAIPPNIQMLECLIAAQRKAKASGLGVWSHRYFTPKPSESLKSADTGFQLVSGVVDRVSIKNSGSWWVLLEGKLALQIPKGSQAFFSQSRLKALKGSRIMVSGWLIRKSLSAKQKAKGYKPYILSLRHPASIISPSVK